MSLAGGGVHRTHPTSRSLASPSFLTVPLPPPDSTPRSIAGPLNWSLLSPFQALEAVNKRLRELYPDSEDIFDIVLMTNNHAQVGVRLINSINHYGKRGAGERRMPHQTHSLREATLPQAGSGYPD